MADKEESSVVKTNFYPHMRVKNNEHPRKLLAFPFLGIIIRFVLLIPVFIYFWLLSIVFIAYWLVTPFIIVFTGKYWDRAYQFNVGYLKLATKIALYYSGLTDTYPGFNRSDNGLFELTIDKPDAPSKLLGFPLLGFIIRAIFMIPYSLYQTVLGQGSQVAILISWFAVLFKGKYPESMYEFVRDSIRVSNAMTAYTAYMSDIYPSFKISMNHKNVKIFLIIVGAILTIANFTTQPDPDAYRDTSNGTMYDSTQDSTDTFSDF